MAKEVNEELNLTPFIGLFAMLVVLLLLTAVWNSVEVLATNSSLPAEPGASSSSSPAPESKPKLELSLTVFTDKIQLQVDQEVQEFPLLQGEIDKVSISRVLTQVKQAHPEKTDVNLYTDNRVPYRHLIESFDLLVANQFPDVGVSTQ